jgi:hypothetical protein
MCTFATDKQPRGAALIIVMLVMAVLLLAGTTFLTISSTESEIAQNQHAVARAFALAETGLHRAIARLSADSTYAGEANVNLGEGTATIGVSVASSQICLSKDLDVLASVSVRGGQAQSRLKATADQAIYPFQWGLLAANGPLILWSLDASATPRAKLDSYDSRLGVYDPMTTGGGVVNVGARGSGVILTNVDLVGSAAGEWVTSSPTTVTNVGRPGDALAPLSEPSATWADDPNVEDNAVLTLPSGIYYFATITLGNGARVIGSGGPVTIYVRGNFRASDNVTIGAEPGEKLSLITNSGTGEPSEFRAGDAFRLFGSLYGTNTKVALGDTAIIHGSMIGQRISGPLSTWEGEPCCNQKAPTLHFDRAMMSRPVCTRGSFSLRRGTWREVLP